MRAFLERSSFKVSNSNIMPDPADYGVTADGYYGRQQRWLAIKKLHVSTPCQRVHHEGPNPDEAIMLLRALSQTCREFRAIALPRLWRVVHVASSSELHRLRCTLDDVPELARHIRVFAFVSERTVTPVHTCLLHNRMELRSQLRRWMLRTSLRVAAGLWRIWGRELEKLLATPAGDSIGDWYVNKAACLPFIQLHDRGSVQTYDAQGRVTSSGSYNYEDDGSYERQHGREFHCKGWHVERPDFDLSQLEIRLCLSSILVAASRMESLVWAHPLPLHRELVSQLHQRQPPLRALQVSLSQDWKSEHACEFSKFLLGRCV